MKSLSSDEQRRIANIFWNNITEDKYNKFCKTMKSVWTYDKRIEHSNKLKSFYENEENRKNKSVEVKSRYDSMSNEKRQQFKETRGNINKLSEKRNKASKTIKKLWDSTEFKNTMKRRKARSGISIKLTFKDNRFCMFDSISVFSKTYNISAYTIRLFLNTNKPILIKKDKHHILTGCYIIKIND
jgi:hypothetical protein